jgi:hypothetical protein
MRGRPTQMRGVSGAEGDMWTIIGNAPGNFAVGSPLPDLSLPPT